MIFTCCFLGSCCIWILVGSWGLRRGCSCIISSFKKLYREVIFLPFPSCLLSSWSCIYIYLIDIDRSLIGLNYMRFGDVFSKYHPFSQSGELFRFSVINYVILFYFFMLSGNNDVGHSDDDIIIIICYHYLSV